MNGYSVYIHTAPNNKVYVGITRVLPATRWKNGQGYQGQSKFYNAIKKYGWNNIRHEILYENLSKEEACNKERLLIDKYDSIANGYNSSSGGEYGNEGSYKYTEGDRVGNFVVVGRNDRKIKVKCLDCGAIIERYAGSLKRGGIKCKCKTKYNPNPPKKELIYITHKGKKQTLTAWSKELDIPKETILYRYKNNSPIDIAKHNPGLLQECPTCGKMFHPKQKTQKYCCQDCGIQSLKISRPSAVCICCGKEFTLKRALSKDYKGLFCSNQCKLNYQKSEKSKNGQTKTA